MASVPFHYLELRAFSYVTEDDERVEEALRLFLPEDCPIDRDTSTGHHGDRILVLSTRVETADEMRVILDALDSLPEDEQAQLRRERDERVDQDCSFFVTLSKQDAARGAVRLGDGITLRGKVEAYPASRDRAIEALTDAGVP